MKNTRFLVNLALCRFQPMLAPDGGADGGSANPGEAGTGNTGTGDEGAEGNKSFDDILKDKKHQSEFDKRIAKALETAKSKWETDYNSKLETAKTEAEKLAKMNADEKAKYAEEKRAEELSKREKEITTRELKAQAYETLAEKGILGEAAKELATILNYESAETCSKSIESVMKVINSNVEKMVNEKLRGGNPPKGNPGSNSSTFGFNFTGVRPKETK